MQNKYLDILNSVFGYSDFRGIQSEIIESIGAGRDTLGLMPTGGGKSITFQVPALALEGVCIVVTPLIALMQDQVQHLRQRGVLASAVYSGMTHDSILKTLENAVHGGVKLLYVSPERLSSHLFLTKLSHMKVSFITVDEAHCISQWGYDFRPSYLEIALIREVLPNVPILALTATATPAVVDDIMTQLQFRKPNVFKMSFRRENLAYIVRKVEDKLEETLHIIRSVEGSAIVYVRSRRRSKEIAELLEKNSVTATFYHAGLEPFQKTQRQLEWQGNRKRVMVATNAFGMGIDKPDVRLVIHYDIPDAIEAYFQEAGRAGRDGKKSYAVTLYNNSDKRKLYKRIDDNYPEKEYIQDVYEHLAYYYQIGEYSGQGCSFQFDIDKFSLVYHYFPVRVNAALSILDHAGYIKYEAEPDNRSRLLFTLSRHELYLLKQLSPDTERLVNVILRTYSGVFVDYVNIDEGYLSDLCDMPREQIYNLLKVLDNNHIISYIPHRNLPSITYSRNRVEGKFVTISEDIYDKLKERFCERIKSMLMYLETDNTCRCAMLLDYFGEKTKEECGLCDVCVENRKHEASEREIDLAQKAILDMLDDNRQHPVTDVYQLSFSSPILDEAMRRLIEEEMIKPDLSYIKKYS